MPAKKPSTPPVETKPSIDDRVALLEDIIEKRGGGLANLLRRGKRLG